MALSSSPTPRLTTLYKSVVSVWQLSRYGQSGADLPGGMSSVETRSFVEEEHVV
jgi:hypothetical protein